MLLRAWGFFKFGFFLIVVDLNVGGFDVLPDLLGWLFLIGGANALAGVHPAFRRARRLGWLIVAARILGMLDVGWFEIVGSLPSILPSGPLWSGASRLAAALPDLLELGFYANVSLGLLAALEFCALPGAPLRQRLRLYATLALARIGIGLFVAPALSLPILSLLQGTGSAALPLIGLVLLELLFFFILLLGWRQAFWDLPDTLPALPVSPGGWRPAWMARARQRVRRPHAIAAILALSAWLIWAAAFNPPPSARVVHKLAGGLGIAERGGDAVFSPDGTRLAVVNLHGPTKIYAAASGELERELPDNRATDLAFSPDGRQLAVINADLTVYDVQTGRELWHLPIGEAGMEHVRWRPDGRQLAILSGSVSLVDVEAMTITATLNERRFNRYLGGAIGYSPDGTLLASAGNQDPIAIWDTDMERLQSTLETSSGKRADVAWNPDGTMIATADDHNVVTLWDIAEARIVRQFAISTIYDKLLGRRPHGTLRTWTSSVAFSPDGTLLAAGSSDASAGIWDVATGRHVLALNGQTDYIGSVAFSPDGRQVLTASTDQTLWVWNVEEAYK
ncbi:MAG TPA: hypothetical protein VD886_25140 [Herpetosiphonaceae bacterium]|nr:hypothetical protein [Herpetosiphonaceae bacterium]